MPQEQRKTRIRKRWHQRHSSIRLLAHLDPLTRGRIILRTALGYWAHFRKPRSFNEHIAHRRFFENARGFEVLTDKLAVRNYVRDRAGERILNPLLAVGNSFDAIDWNAMPDSFIVKATHGCGWNHIVRRKTVEELAELRAKCERWLASTFGVWTHELWYGLIPPRLIVEPILTDERYEQLPDYKCHVFHGRVQYVQVCMDRFGDVNCRCYDRDWKPQEWRNWDRLTPRLVPPPANFENLLSVAETLGKHFEYIRVDLYCPDDRRVVFGEMTLCPRAGRFPFVPDRTADFDLGSFW